MNKGKQLSVLLDKADTLHREMNQVFLKHGFCTPDLSLLSSTDQKEWYRLYDLSIEVTNEICKLINK